MKSDTDVFGQLNPKKLKFLDGPNAPDDPNATVDGSTSSPAQPNAPASFDPNANVDQNTPQPKTPQDYNGNGMSQTQPVGQPQALSDIAPKAAAPVTDTPAAPVAAGASNVNTGGYTAPAVVTPRTGAPPPGYDASKWADPNHQSPKYAVAGIVQQAIARGDKNLTPDTVSAIAKAYPGATQINGTSMNIPGIGTVQVMNDGQARWDNINGNDAPMGDAGGASLADALAGKPTPTPTGFAIPTGNSVGIEPWQTGAPGQAQADDLASLMASDPAIAANKVALSKQYGDLRSQAAEQASVQGEAGSGAFAGKTRQLEEDQANAQGDFAGNRVAQAQQLEQQKSQFTQQLGFNYAQLSQQQKQFMSNLGQNQDQFLKSLGLSYAQLSSQQRLALQQLAQSQDQFNKTLGFNYDNLEANQNNIAAGAEK